MDYKEEKIVLEPEKIVDTWTEYFEDLLSVEIEVEHDEQKAEQQQQQKIAAVDISMEEIISALKEIKERKG